MHYINELKDGSSVKEIYLCKKRQSLVTRAGKAYESLTCQDKTGTLDAKIWAPDSMGQCWIGDNGYMVEETKWIQYFENWYYIQKGYRAENTVIWIDNDWYSFDLNGICENPPS